MQAGIIPKQFTVEPNGEPRTIGHSIVAWWVGNWLDAGKLQTHEALKALADKLTNCNELGALAMKPHEYVILEINRERERQIDIEGWTPDHDDVHSAGEMADAAACYASAPLVRNTARPMPPSWPFASKWWKPKTRRRDLIRAAALIVAEIERLDRNQKHTLAAIESANAVK